MSGRHHDVALPGESVEYREARDQLLDREIELRSQIEEVAALRRALPSGGRVKDDYVFEEGSADLADSSGSTKVKLSQFFAPGKNSLIIYGFMYGPGEEDRPCPMCTSLLDSLNGTALHAHERVNLVIVARAPLQRIRTWAAQRHWDNLRLLSSADNTYNQDYYAEDDDGDQDPSLNVFVKSGGEIFHYYNSELFFASNEEGQNPRHCDLIWPLWGLLDLTPEGRGTDWYPKTSY